ncbi:hypothetical protein [Bradyrhizobium liaoningense]|uniref:hypothetical protein n=1 Tax=Bradyrhizobium liaoningense TaxID=43992 RepID=UPI0012FDDEE6|nr:hypothetical protein [Bradyrhizobium liaoningense]
MSLTKKEFDKFILDAALHIGSEIAAEPIEEGDLHLEAARLALVEVARKNKCPDDEVGTGDNESKSALSYTH